MYSWQIVNWLRFYIWTMIQDRQFLLAPMSNVTGADKPQPRLILCGQVMVQRAGTVVEPVDAVWTCNPQFISIIPLSLYKQIEWRRQAAGKISLWITLQQVSQGLGGFYRRSSIVDLRWRTSAAAVGMKRVESVFWTTKGMDLFEDWLHPVSNSETWNKN